MSKFRAITPGEVQKKIIRNPPKARPKGEILGPFDKYRDENFAIYNEKKKQFLDACRQYNRHNRSTLLQNKKRLMEDYREMIDLKFLDGQKGEDLKNETKSEEMIRKRTERPIHEVIKPKNPSLTMVNWTVRYSKLNRFISAARKIILQNRLLKVLSVLKKLTFAKVRDLEKGHRTYLNVSYAEVFEKFM